MSNTVPPSEDAAPTPQDLDAAAAICSGASSDFNRNETLEKACHPPQPEDQLAPHHHRPMPQNSSPKYKESAPNILVNLKTATSGSQQPVCAVTRKMPAHLDAIDPNELQLHPARTDGFVNKAASISMPQIVTQKKLPRGNVPHKISGPSTAHRSQTQGTATMTEDFLHGMDVSMDTRDGYRGIGGANFAIPIPGPFTNTWKLSEEEEEEEEDKVTAAPKNFFESHFAKVGQTALEGPISVLASENPWMRQVLQRYNTLSPSLQRPLAREFLFQIDRYCHALDIQNTLTTPNQATSEVPDLSRWRSESEALKCPQGQTQVLLRSQAKSNSQAKSQTRSGSRSQSQGQLQTSSNPEERNRIPYFVPTGLQPQVGPHGLEYFLTQDPNTPSASHGPVTPSPTSTAPVAGSPPMGLVLPQSSTPSGSSARNPRNTRNRRNPATPKAPSKHCHICCRRPSLNSLHVACGNLALGTCRKTICEKCFTDTHWHGKVDAATARSLGRNWKCTHCVGVCPSRAQCFIYGRSSERRRKRRQAELDAAARFEHEQAALAQAAAQAVDAHVVNGQAVNPQSVNAQVVTEQAVNGQAANAEDLVAETADVQGH